MSNKEKPNKEIPKVQKKTVKNPFRGIFGAFRTGKLKVKKLLLNLLNKLSNLKELFFYGVIYGALINYSLYSVFGVPFDWRTFSGYGIFLYLTKSELIDLWTELWFRKSSE